MTKTLLHSQRQTLYEITGVRFGTSEEEYLWGKEILEDKSAALVFADWLEERGDRRGELIRVECEIRSLAIPPSPGPPFVTLINIKDSVRHKELWDRRMELRLELGYDEPQRVPEIPIIGGQADGETEEPGAVACINFDGSYSPRTIPDALGTPRACYVWDGWTGDDAELTRRVSAFYLERCGRCDGKSSVRFSEAMGQDYWDEPCFRCHGTGWLEKGDYE